MRRLAILSLMSALLAGCVVVPGRYDRDDYYRHGYYHHGYYDHGYHGGYYRDWDHG